jgi:hypothetical protein
MPRPLQSPKKKVARRELRHRRIILLAVGFALVVVGLVMLSRLDSLTIRSVEIADETVTTARELQTVADMVLDGNWLLLFPRRNSLLYPEETLKAAVIAAFPRVSDVTIKRPNAHTLVLSLSEREPYALWCEGSADEGAHGVCYFLDHEGVVFARAPEFSGPSYFTYHGALSGTASTTPMGGRFMEIGQFKQILEFLDVLGTFGDKPLSFSISKDGHDYEVGLTDGLRILFSPESDFTLTLENIRSTLASEAIQDAAKQGKALDSIDVRFGNRVYYKVK